MSLAYLLWQLKQKKSDLSLSLSSVYGFDSVDIVENTLTPTLGFFNHHRKGLNTKYKIRTQINNTNCTFHQITISITIKSYLFIYLPSYLLSYPHTHIPTLGAVGGFSKRSWE